jgi:hypothetical protein
MQQGTTRPKRLGWRLAAAVLAPFAVASVYLFLTRWPSYRFTAFSDYAGLSVSVLIGAAFIAMSPIPAHLRVFSLLLYVPVVAAMVIFYGFCFIGVVFHDGL